MPLFYVSGDPLHTQAHVLAFGYNARGRTELGTFETQLSNRYPAAFSAYRKQCDAQRLKPGDYWVWRESKPALAFLVVRESSVGATRLRYVQSAAMNLGRDYRLEGFKSLAIAPLGSEHEWPEIKLVLQTWFGMAALPVVIYDTYLPGVTAEETLA